MQECATFRVHIRGETMATDQPKQPLDYRAAGVDTAEGARAVEGIRLKLNPMRHIIEGKRLLVVDDSIVRGNTSKRLVQLLRESGAAEVHVRLTSPPVVWPCFYGIDTESQDELIASTHTVEEITEFIGADSVAFLDIEDLIASTGRSRGDLCTACFSGDYPIAIPDALGGGKLHLEQPE